MAAMALVELPKRLRSKFDAAPDGCWLWTASLNNMGYGTTSGKMAHRVIYEALVGPIPEGLDLDHLCRTPRCVNPAHLEPVTRRENLLRGDTLPAANAHKTRCPRGHKYDETNTYITKRGKRHCRACDRDRKRRGGV